MPRTRTQSRASKGGTARAASLTPEQRSQSARKAVLARWSKRGQVVKHPRAIVSVLFRQEDFEEIDKAAEKAGVPISKFIREATMRRVRPSVFAYPPTQTSSSVSTHFENLTVWYAA